jgi:small subunit ribosomal protein S3
VGQKVDPRGLRLGITRTWDSNWFAEGEAYLNFFHEDVKVRNFVKDKYNHAGISSVKIERTSSERIVVIINTAKAGILIGRKGQEIENLRVALEKITGKKVVVKVNEVKQFNKDALLVAESIAQAIEKRVAYKKAVKQAITRAEKAGVQGIKVMTSGRLNGAEIARSEQYHDGTIPLQTIRADIDYGFAEAHTTFGMIGVKCWIYKGEVLKTAKAPAQAEGGAL